MQSLDFKLKVDEIVEMINDDLKLIEDAFNEATLMMRKNKDAFEEQYDK